MTIKRTVTTIVAFLTFVMLASVNAGAATAEPDLEDCQTEPWRSEVVHEYQEGSWAYFYRLIWCVEGTTVRWVESEVTPVLPDNSDCSWVETKENSVSPLPDSNSRLGFNMGWFSCPDEPDDYPWGIILVHPNGTSHVLDQGTA